MTIHDLDREAVARGAALLDEHRPEWRSLIDMDTLDLSNGCLCILGQVYSEAAKMNPDLYVDGYDYGINVLDIDDPKYVGFDAVTRERGRWDKYRDLQEAWVELLTTERPDADWVHPCPHTPVCTEQTYCDALQREDAEPWGAE